jgi:hypothetical protein
MHTPVMLKRVERLKLLKVLKSQLLARRITNRNKFASWETGSFHGVDYEDYCLLECNAV